jgi:hypothetical protein
LTISTLVSQASKLNVLDAFSMSGVDKIWYLDGAQPQVFSGFNLSLEEKHPLSNRVCCLERWLFLTFFYFNK